MDSFTERAVAASLGQGFVFMVCQLYSHFPTLLFPE